ncbi:MAG TPA: DinB family protein [Thermoanaerobaculia bacterium]|nr:DinB family protein [Thermoanaerobaculia bacterium]
MESPRTLEQIIAAFDQQEIESVAYWSAFDTGTFFRRIGSAWSPAENVRHLIKSIRPVVIALGTSKILLRLRFGKARRPSMTYDDLCRRYLQGLAEGGQAGRFAPSPREEDDPAAWREAIMRDFVRVNRDLRKMLARWPDVKLDRLQLPHPLLGNLTVREMLFFTLYHQRHHIDVVERRLTAVASM